MRKTRSFLEEVSQSDMQLREEIALLCEGEGGDTEGETLLSCCDVPSWKGRSQFRGARRRAERAEVQGSVGRRSSEVGNQWGV